MFLNDQMLDSGALARRLLAPANNLVPVNLLTRQQASLEDAGTAGFGSLVNCTIARSTTYAASGSASLAVTSSAAGSTVVYAGDATTTVTSPSKVPVTPGRTFTAVLSARSATSTATARIRIHWWKADGTSTAGALTNGADVAMSTSGFNEYRVTAVAASDAAYASVSFIWTAAAGSEVVYIDKVGIWEGAGGSWVNGGERLDPSTLGGYWNAAGTGYYRWNTVTNAYVLIYGS